MISPRSHEDTRRLTESSNLFVTSCLRGSAFLLFWVFMSGAIAAPVKIILLMMPSQTDRRESNHSTCGSGIGEFGQKLINGDATRPPTRTLRQRLQGFDGIQFVPNESEAANDPNWPPTRSPAIGNLCCPTAPFLWLKLADAASCGQSASLTRVRRTGRRHIRHIRQSRESARGPVG